MRFRLALILVVLATAIQPMTAASADPGVTPSSVEVTLAPGAQTTIEKSIETASVSSSPDIMFLADTTGSMGSAIASVQSAIGNIIDTIQAVQPDARFGAAQYKDFGDAFAYNLDTPITANEAAVTTAVGTWSASGGGDTPEAQINALYHLGSDTNVGWRDGSSHIIVQFGDAPGHDPSDGHTLNHAISALGTIDARYLGIDVGALNQVPNESSSTTGQATLLAVATGGLVLPAGGDVAAAILSGLQTLDATVTPTLGACDPGITMSWDASSKTVAGGETAIFQETIALDGDVTPGSTLDCEVSFLVNGGSDPAFVETTTVHVEGDAADLSITKSASPDPVKAGNVLSYTIDVTNTGPDDVTGAAVDDTFPGTLSGESWTCSITTGPGNCGSASGSGDIHTTVNLNAGSTAEYFVTATVSASATGSISNTATVTAPGGTTDPNTGNNSATAVTAVTASSTPDNAAGFCSGTGTCTVSTDTGAGATPGDPTVSTITLPSGADPQVVTVTESSGAQSNICGGRPCSGQVVTFESTPGPTFAGVTDRRNPAVVRVTYDRSVNGGLLLFVDKGTGRPRLVLPCLRRGIAFPSPCISTLSLNSQTRDLTYTVLFLEGDPTLGRR